MRPAACLCDIAPSSDDARSGLDWNFSTDGSQIPVFTTQRLASFNFVSLRNNRDTPDYHKLSSPPSKGLNYPIRYTLSRTL
ncbi:hypothetical protein CEP52_014531 [Fusarium oligoseptatum]|uniref:Uncharacterized protein n=1 Tax=Fusarium oligoseptatum TaxID=2604345 RepID=A0A428SLF7_9HYPO|nr:hypothetical protein CEP52_014531 [Fusarium oligoseptatum]